jgi:putative N6-adenine-specific DNA methylase
MGEFEILVGAAFGLEAIVVRELRDLGYEQTKVEDGRIRFPGNAAALCRCNLWLRCAERVQVVVGEFPAKNFDELFDQIKTLPWEQWLAADAKFPVDARTVRSEIRSVPNVQKMVKRAIVERLRQVYSRHWFAETGVEYQIEASIVHDRVLLTIDATGDGLHKRGYRQMMGAAPLRETTAAALVKLSYWNRDRLLVDPFCGSGTIPIEAALIGRNMAPGRNRNFAAENWPQIPQSVWSAARQEARDLEDRRPFGVPIVGSDRDKEAVRQARYHAKLAGVGTDIHFEQKDFVAFPTNRDYGVLICNPPYGERLGTEDEVRQLYQDMGELLRELDTWSLYILTAAEGFERLFGRRADRRRKLYNARIACTYFQYLGPRPPGSAPDEDAPETADPSPEPPPAENAP